MAGYDINVGRDLLPGLLSGQKRRVTGSGLEESRGQVLH